jgi:hypothetical protein
MSSTILKRAADLMAGDYIVRDPDRPGNSHFYAGEVTETENEGGRVRIVQARGWFFRTENQLLEVRS